jgi:acetyltransferase
MLRRVLRRIKPGAQRPRLRYSAAIGHRQASRTTETIRMEIDEIHDAVRATVASVAPGVDLQRIRPDRPLREQIELDSMDWLNLVGALHERLHVDVPESDYGRIGTIDAIVAYVASRLAAPSAVPSATPARVPADAPRSHRLADGTALTVRPIRAADAPLEADFFQRLSDDSRYKRFMGVLHELPEGKLKYLTEVDQVHHVALVATVERSGREAVIGVARYVVDPSGSSCEFAVTVDDAWHHCGVAGILMHALIDRAREQGLARMEGIVLAANRPMLKFVRQLGFTVQPDPDDRCTVRAVRELQGGRSSPTAPAAPGSR